MRAIVLATLMVGCVVHPTSSEHFVDRIDGDLERITFDVCSGDVTVRVTDVETAEVHRTVRWRNIEPESTLYVDGDTLVLDVDCPALCSGCAVDHEVLLPAGTVVSGTTGAGDVSVRGTGKRVEVESGAGDVTLEQVGDVIASTGSGNLQLDEVGGTVDLDSGAGHITGLRLESEIGIATSGAGDIDLSWTVAPTHADLSSGAGDVAIQVPEGHYRVDATTSAGEVTVEGLISDPDAPASLTLRSDAGDVRVLGSGY